MTVNAGQYKTTYLTALTDTKSTDVEGVGCLRLVAGKLYRWVKIHTGTTATVATVANGAVGFLATDTTLTTVCTDVTDCIAGLAAGVTLAAGITDNYYGWIQVGGLSGALAVDVTGTTPAVGDAVSLSATDNAFKVDPPITDLKAGVLVDVTGSANLVWLDCPIRT